MARSHGLKAKTLRRMLKKKGMKTTGKKVTLMKRLHMRGGNARDDAIAKAKDMPETTQEEAEARCAAQKEAFAMPDSMEEEKPPEPMPQERGGRRRRRSRRREEGGRRRGRKSRRGEMLGY